jgi:putative nucleotidyltransferase with HDIG domain
MSSLSVAAATDPAPEFPRGSISRVLATFDELPAFGPACDHALAAAMSESASSGSDLVTAIESDTGLTVAVLRRAQRLPGRRPIINVPDAVEGLGHDRVQAVVERIARAAFPWRTAQEALIHDVRVHSQTVAQAAHRVAEEVGFADRDDLIAAALLHDVGKLVVALAIGDTGWAADTRGTTPEQRVRDERQRLTLDHATLGALLAERWGLPERISDTIASHHRSDAEADLTSVLRLADMVAHQARGDSVDRRIMLRLASLCGLSVAALKETLFDLPQSGSPRRRAQPCPLTKRETAALRGIASGKVYKEIATDLGVTASTVRSHLQRVYAKLEVADRAQAVLLATRMNWI